MKKIIVLLFLSLNFCFSQSLTLTPTEMQRFGGSSYDINIKKSGDYPTIIGYRSGGTQGAPTSTPINHLLLQIGAGGFFNGSYQVNPKAFINFYSTENWTNTANGSKITFNTTPNGTTSGEERMTILDNGNIGIGINTPTEKLHVVGNIRSSSLAGSGVRNLYTDANGIVTASQQTFTLTIPPQAFQRRFNTGGGTLTALGPYGDCYILGANINDELVAPVILPNGAIITQVQVYFTDVDPTNNLRFRMGWVPLASGSNFDVVNLFQPTQNAQTFNVTTITSSTLAETISQDKTYRMLVYPTDASGNYGSGVWNTSSYQMSIKGVKITYTL